MSDSRPKYRRATLEDVGWVTAMIGRFYAGIGVQSYQIPFDEASTAETVKRIVEQGICLVGERSCAGAWFYRFPFNAGARLAYVQFWCFEKAREIGIFEALVKECREAGALRIVAISHPPHHRIMRRYAKMNGRVFEACWMLE